MLAVPINTPRIAIPTEISTAAGSDRVQTISPLWTVLKGIPRAISTKVATGVSVKARARAIRVTITVK